jgi:low affinity Fe/Cu permease
MRKIILISILTVIQTVSFAQTANKKQNIQKNNNILNTISAIDAKFPLILNKINLQDKNNIIYLNDGINSKIRETIKEYANEIAFYDSTHTYKNIYINTIRLCDSLQTIFVVLFKHYPTGYVNSKVLFYDNVKKEFADKTFDFNLWALYHFENGEFKPTNLKTDLKITTPEIELVDNDQDGINDFKFVRLWHNGTFNAIHTTILTIRNSQLETILFDELPIEYE